MPKIASVILVFLGLAAFAEPARFLVVTPKPMIGAEVEKALADLLRAHPDKIRFLSGQSLFASQMLLEADPSVAAAVTAALGRIEKSETLDVSELAASWRSTGTQPIDATRMKELTEKAATGSLRARIEAASQLRNAINATEPAQLAQIPPGVRDAAAKSLYQSAKPIVDVFNEIYLADKKLHPEARLALSAMTRALDRMDAPTSSSYAMRLAAYGDAAGIGVLTETPEAQRKYFARFLSEIRRAADKRNQGERGWIDPKNPMGLEPVPLAPLALLSLPAGPLKEDLKRALIASYLTNEWKTASQDRKQYEAAKAVHQAQMAKIFGPEGAAANAAQLDEMFELNYQPKRIEMHEAVRNSVVSLISPIHLGGVPGSNTAEYFATVLDIFTKTAQLARTRELHQAVVDGSRNLLHILEKDDPLVEKFRELATQNFVPYTGEGADARCGSRLSKL